MEVDVCVGLQKAVLAWQLCSAFVVPSHSPFLAGFEFREAARTDSATAEEPFCGHTTTAAIRMADGLCCIKARSTLTSYVLYYYINIQLIANGST